jgi:predicted component of type VI protein secretion system
MHALTTYELRNYRRELERALETLPSHATVREQFRQRLTDVLTEEQARTQLQQAGRS